MMDLPAAVRRVASSLLGRQALLSGLFAVFVLITLVVQTRIPLAAIETAHGELGGLDRIAATHRFLASVAQREIDGERKTHPSGAASVLVAFEKAGPEFSRARDRVAQKWRDVRSGSPRLDALGDLATATEILAVKISDASQLTYDEDVDGINYGDLLSTQLPRALDRATRAIAIGERLARRSPIADRLAIARYEAQAEVVWAASENDFELGSEATATDLAELGRAHADASRAFLRVRAALALADRIDAIPTSRVELRRSGDAFITASLAYAYALEGALREIIVRRIARERSSLALSAALALLTLALAILAEVSRRRSADQHVALATARERATSFEMELVRQRADRARVLNEAQFRTIFDNSPLAIATLDARGEFVERNRAMVAMVDEPFAIFDTTFDLDAYARVVGGSSPPYEAERLSSRGGALRWIDLTVFPIRIVEGESVAAIVMIADITERKEQAERLAFDADHDAMTGLRSRPSFLECVAASIEAARNEDGLCRALMLIDLDRFKFVNDTFGHACGDEVLVEVAGRLRRVFRPTDVIARLHGDEFALLVVGRDRAEIVAYAKRLQLALREPILVSRQSITIDSSVGICIVSGMGLSETVMHDADTAMYQAKRGGRGRHVVFDDDMRDAAARYGRLGSEMLESLRVGDFRVVYQPIVELADGSISGFESLLRWRHPHFGEISPVEFIPIAEDLGTIRALGSFALREACSQAGRWNRRYPEDAPVTISVNLSARQLVEGIVLEVERNLRDAGIDGASLVLEITESALLESGPQIADIFTRLRATGARLCLDDFGTGYSSLRYLQQFPIDELKIDRSFVAGADGSLASEPIARMLLGLAEALEIDVVAEGIETEIQERRLVALGAKLGQGYWFARPGPPSDFEGSCGLSLRPVATALEGAGVA